MSASSTSASARSPTLPPSPSVSLKDGCALIRLTLGTSGPSPTRSRTEADGREG